jgi:DNA-directed RNA polymerase subunit RPC12/RpoP
VISLGSVRVAWYNCADVAIATVPRSLLSVLRARIGGRASRRSEVKMKNECVGCGRTAGSDTRSGVRRAIEERGEKDCPECGAACSSSAESCARCGAEFARALLGTIDRMLGRSGASPAQSLDPRPGETVDERDARHRASRNFAQTGAFSRPLREESRGPRPIYALSPVPGVRLVVGYVREGFDAFEARSTPDRFERECQRVARCAAGYR